MINVKRFFVRPLFGLYLVALCVHPTPTCLAPIQYCNFHGSCHSIQVGTALCAKAQAQLFGCPRTRVQFHGVVGILTNLTVMGATTGWFQQYTCFSGKPFGCEVACQNLKRQVFGYSKCLKRLWIGMVILRLVWHTLRSILICWVLAALGHVFLLEQPTGSNFRHFPQWRFFCKYICKVTFLKLSLNTLYWEPWIWYDQWFYILVLPIYDLLIASLRFGARECGCDTTGQTAASTLTYGRIPQKFVTYPLENLQRRRFHFSLFFVGMGFECRILSFQVIGVSWHPCSVATGAAVVCSAFGGEESGSWWQSSGNWS